MTQAAIDPDRFSKGFLLLLAIAITAAFVTMVGSFLLAVLFAAILAGLTHPFYRWVLKRVGKRESLASGLTVLAVLLVIVLPAMALIGIVAAEAVQVTERVAPWVEQQLQEPDELDRLLSGVPLLDSLAPYKSQIMAKAGELAGRAGSFLVTALAATTKGTAVFFFQLFIMLYALFFFIVDGRRTLDRILYYVPLGSAEEDRMVDRFLSVSRATLKGTLVIGLMQGVLAGVAFRIAGIDGAFFWGTIMGVLSCIPGVGAALVWIPATLYLFAIGRPGAALGLAAWCALAVGSVDNLLRPRLVGKDTQMPDLLIFLSTLGGIVAFGAAGVLLGPILAALLVTVWHIYGMAFQDVLPERSGS